MHLISHSQLSTFRECPRKYRFKYVLGRETVSLDPKLYFGRIWDDATGIWWKDGVEAAVEWLCANAAAIDPVDAAKIAALLKHYSPPRSRFRFVDNQVRWEIPVRNPDTGYPMHGMRLLCIADSLLEDMETGATIVREAKSTTNDIKEFGPYWQRLQVDSQVNFYHLAFGANVLFYDVARRPTLKCCGKDEAAAKERHETPTEQQIVDAYQDRLEADIADDPEKFFQWRPIHKTDDDLTVAMRDLYQQARMLRESWKQSWWPRNSNACRGMFGVCPFLQVCTGQASIEDESLFQTTEWARQRQLPVVA